MIKDPRYDHWMSEFLFKHPLLTSNVEVLPGVSVLDLVCEVSERVWCEAVYQERKALGTLYDDTRDNQPAQGSTRVHVLTPVATFPSSVPPTADTDIPSTKRQERKEKHGVGIKAYWANMTPEQKAAEVRKRFGNRLSKTTTDQLKKIESA